MAHAVNAGHEPRAIAEALVRHLRNGFLSLMAPELVQLAAHQVDELAAQAQRLGPAALVQAHRAVRRDPRRAAPRPRSAGARRGRPRAADHRAAGATPTTSARSPPASPSSSRPLAAGPSGGRAGAGRSGHRPHGARRAGPAGGRRAAGRGPARRRRAADPGAGPRAGAGRRPPAAAPDGDLERGVGAASSRRCAAWPARCTRPVDVVEIDGDTVTLVAPNRTAPGQVRAAPRRGRGGVGRSGGATGDDRLPHRRADATAGTTGPAAAGADDDAVDLDELVDAGTAARRRSTASPRRSPAPSWSSAATLTWPAPTPLRSRR